MCPEWQHRWTLENGEKTKAHPLWADKDVAKNRVSNMIHEVDDLDTIFG